MTKHVFFILSDMGLGGIQKKIDDLAHLGTFQHDGSTVRFHCIFRDAPTFFDTTSSSNFMFHREPKLKIFRRYQEQWFDLYIWLLCVWYRPHTVVSFLHFWADRVLSIKNNFLFFPRTKLILSQDTVLSLYNQPQHTSRVYSKTEVKRVYSQMQRVLVQTKTAKNDLIKNYQIPAFKIFVIPNWLPANVTKQPKTDRDIDILYFGRFERQKRLEILIEVIEKLAAQNASLSAYLVGDGSENQMLQELVNKKNLDSIISILPPTAKIQEYLYRSKFFVLTSDFEGQPISLLEAMSAGVIPVTLEFPGVHEYIQVGENGFVEASPSKLRARLKKLLSDTSRCRELSRTIAREVKLKYGDETREKFLEALF